MTFHKVGVDATGNPLYELDQVEYEGKWYTIHKHKGVYYIENDEARIELIRVPSFSLFLVEHFF